MQLVLAREQILSNLYSQIRNFFAVTDEEKQTLEDNLDSVLFLCETCFAGSPNKYFVNQLGEVRFNPLHSVQYMIFLYFMAHTLYENKKGCILCDKLYYLNKIMNGLDMFYAIQLPKVFGAEHPVGTVLGRAAYGENFFFYQGCTVGGNYDKNGVLHYPVIGKNVKMFANSSIIGKCIVGDNVFIGAGAIVKNENVPDNSIVFGQSPNLILKKKGV